MCWISVSDRRLVVVDLSFEVGMICCCLDRCTFKKQLSGRADYSFHYFNGDLPIRVLSFVPHPRVVQPT